MDLSKLEMGPRLSVCSEQERRFVLAFVENGDGDATRAARDAGYVDNDNGAIRVRAHVLMHRPRVLDALEEVSKKLFRAQLVTAVRANQRLLENQKHPDHARTVQATLSRLGLAEKVGIDVNVSGEVTVNHSDQAVADLKVLVGLGVARERLVEIFGFSGLSRYEKMLAEQERRALPLMIEGEATRVE